MERRIREWASRRFTDSPSIGQGGITFESLGDPNLPLMTLTEVLGVGEWAREGVAALLEGREDAEKAVARIGVKEAAAVMKSTRNSWGMELDF
jgi:hypothetical protein